LPKGGRRFTPHFDHPRRCLIFGMPAAVGALFEHGLVRKSFPLFGSAF